MEPCGTPQETLTVFLSLRCWVWPTTSCPHCLRLSPIWPDWGNSTSVTTTSLTSRAASTTWRLWYVHQSHTEYKCPDFITLADSWSFQVRYWDAEVLLFSFVYWCSEVQSREWTSGFSHRQFGLVKVKGATRRHFRKQVILHHQVLVRILLACGLLLGQS